MPHKWPLRIKSGHSKAPRPHANGIYTNYVQPNPTGGSRWIVQFMFNRIPPAGIGGSFNLCSTESHRRESVDRSIYVQPNPTGGSRWIVQSQPTRTGKIPRNPTTGR